MQRQKGRSQEMQAREKEKGFNVYFSGANRELAFRIQKKITDPAPQLRGNRRAESNKRCEVLTNFNISTDANTNKWKARAKPGQAGFSESGSRAEDLTRTEPIKYSVAQASTEPTNNRHHGHLGGQVPTIQSFSLTKSFPEQISGTEKDVYDKLLSKLSELKGDESFLADMLQQVERRIATRNAKPQQGSLTSLEKVRNEAPMARSKITSKVEYVIDRLDIFKDQLSIEMSKRKPKKTEDPSTPGNTHQSVVFPSAEKFEEIQEELHAEVAQ